MYAYFCISYEYHSLVLQNTTGILSISIYPMSTSLISHTAVAHQWSLQVFFVVVFAIATWSHMPPSIVGIQLLIWYLLLCNKPCFTLDTLLALELPNSSSLIGTIDRVLFTSHFFSHSSTSSTPRVRHGFIHPAVPSSLGSQNYDTEISIPYHRTGFNFRFRYQFQRRFVPFVGIMMLSSPLLVRFVPAAHHHIECVWYVRVCWYPLLCLT